MVLQQPPARGLRRAVGQTLISVCTVLVGYGSWAAQADFRDPHVFGCRASLRSMTTALCRLRRHNSSEGHLSAIGRDTALWPRSAWRVFAAV